MKFQQNYLFNYVKDAPLPLAIERSLECEILSKQDFIHPILDIGCGEGLFAKKLFSEKIDVGIDPNPRELKRAEKYQMYNELIECFGDNIPKESGSYNTIFSNSVLEHIKDIKPVLKEANRLLADNGKFYVTVPTDKFDQYTVVYRFLSWLGLKGMARKYQNFFNDFWNHYHYYNKENWEKLFQQCGFKIIDSREYCSKTVATLNDFLAPFSLISFINKKIFNKWTYMGWLRSVYSYPLYSIAKRCVKRYENGNSGGIIFFILVKQK